MKSVRLDGPSARLLAYGHELLRGGDPVEMSNADAARLDADPRINVTVTDVDEPEAPRGEGQPTAHKHKED